LEGVFKIIMGLVRDDGGDTTEMPELLQRCQRCQRDASDATEMPELLQRCQRCQREYGGD